MNDFPRMLYKHGGPEEIHGGRFSTHIVHDVDELDAALAGGWHMTTPEAKAAAEKPVSIATASSTAIPDDNAPATRAELEQKARELGIDFAPNIGDKKLAERIDAALAGGEKA
jgi:hypothetical protein